MSEIRKSMQNKFGEIIGEASMCWVEAPTSVFDSTRAVALVQKCLDVVHQEIGMGVTRYSEIMSENAKLKRANEIMKDALEEISKAHSGQRVWLSYRQVEEKAKQALKEVEAIK